MNKISVGQPCRRLPLVAIGDLNVATGQLFRNGILFMTTIHDFPHFLTKFVIGQQRTK
jgi:hypothetical protein